MCVWAHGNWVCGVVHNLLLKKAKKKFCVEVTEETMETRYSTFDILTVKRAVIESKLTLEIGLDSRSDTGG